MLSSRTAGFGALAALVLAAVVGCASMGPPPGGPPDHDPPFVTQVIPDSDAVLEQPPSQVTIVFDEVIAERVAGTRPDIQYSVLLSPDTGLATVDWHRGRLTVKPKHGFQAGRIYRLEVLPVISDLRNNRMRRSHLTVFSTGPAIPSARLSGTVVDWPAGRAAPNGLIEAFLLPDSLDYRAIADSIGNFSMPAMPPGTYLVYGTIDQSGDRRRGPSEAFDTVRLTLSDSARADLYAFVHDTTAPRLRQVELADSLTVRVSFTAPLAPGLAIDTSQAHLAPASDSTQLIGVAAVLTQVQLDSVRAAATAAAAAARAAARGPGDTTRGRPAAPDTSRAPHGPPGRPGAAASGPAPRDTTQRVRHDTTLAQRMLLRRPPPTDIRFLRLAAPLTPGQRYVVIVDSVRSITGVWGGARGQLLAPVPKPPSARDTSRARGDTTRTHVPAGGAVPRAAADTSRTAAPPDTTRPVAPPDTTRPSAPPDTLRRHPGT